MTIRKVLLYVLASAALLATGIMADDPAAGVGAGAAAGGCGMTANPAVMCQRPAANP